MAAALPKISAIGLILVLVAYASLSGTSIMPSIDVTEHQTAEASSVEIGTSEKSVSTVAQQLYAVYYQVNQVFVDQCHQQWTHGSYFIILTFH